MPNQQYLSRERTQTSQSRQTTIYNLDKNSQIFLARINSSESCVLASCPYKSKVRVRKYALSVMFIVVITNTFIGLSKHFPHFHWIGVCLW